VLTEQLTNLETDSSVYRNDEAQGDEIASSKLSKKRIGPYSYRLDDIVGSGFSSTVYKGFKDNNLASPVAIKVVQVRHLKHHSRSLV
jgi:hypothetical protein